MPESVRRLSTVPWWCWILVIVLMEAVAVLILLPTPWSEAVGNGDGAEYQRYAFNLLHHGVFSESPMAPYLPGLVRSPGYPAFLAAVEWIAGRHAVAVQAVQFGVLAVTAILVGLIGREVAMPAVANVAAFLCAIYLPFVDQATVFLTEALATCLLAAVVLLLLRARRAGGVGIYAAIGLVLSLATYIRPESAILAVPVVLILMRDRRSSSSAATRWMAVAVFAATLVIPLVPWLVRDASVTGGAVVPMAADGGVALLASVDQYDGLMSQGFADVKRWNAQVGKLVGVPAAATQGIQATVKFADARRQLQIDKLERSKALALIEAVSPATVVKRLPVRILAMWTPADENPPAMSGAWHRLAQVQWVLLVIAALVGLAARRRLLLRDWALWLVPVYLTLIHLIFPVEARYTVPARPTLMIYASVGAIAVGSLLARRRSAAPRPGSSWLKPFTDV